MSNAIRAVLAMGAVAALAACGNPEPEPVVVVQPEPIQPEPVSEKF
ncbi:MAG: hypothetical protein AAF919_03920 [Pseudomonadota bacterium]